MSTRNLEVHEDWATSAFDLDPVAPHTGPFVRRNVLSAWHRHRGAGGKLVLAESADALIPLFAHDTAIQFLGEADLTDYHSPLGAPDAVEALAQTFFSGLSPRTHVELDSLPAEAAAPLEAGLRSAGIDVTRLQHEVAAVLSLPDSYDDWIQSIGKKERHEVRRKRRRFEEDLGPPDLVRVEGPEAVALFTAMHRGAAGDKGTFMTAQIAEFFGELHTAADGVIDVLFSHAGDPVASAFGFEDLDAYYLYNSAYNPEVRRASPGIVMLASLIERAIDGRRRVFDFLKGDEPYKFRHGAEPRPLFSLTGVVPG